MGLDRRLLRASLVSVSLALVVIVPAAAQSTGRPPSMPAGGEVITFGADTEVLRETFISGDRWGLLQDENGSIAYADGALHMAITVAPSAKWTWSELGVQVPVFWVRTDITLSAAGGAAGPMCGSAGDTPAFIFGVVTSSDEWVVGRAFENALTVLARGPLPQGVSVAGGVRAVVALECAMTGSGGDRAALTVDGVGDLTAHIPMAFSANCSTAEPDPDNGLLAVVQCAPAGDIASAAYFHYATVEQLEGAFDALLEAKGVVPDGADCNAGPALIEYTIGDATAGRLACYRIEGTSVVQWTNRDLRIMGFGADASGDFTKVFAWWQNAGPLP